MKPKVNNKCQNRYRINVEKLINGTIDKVPEKYFEGLDEVTLLDFGKDHYPICRYVHSNKGKSRKIEMYMDNQILHKIPFISPLALNIYLLLAVNQHIDQYLKNKTEDIEIFSIDTNRVNYSWMYFPRWNPLFLVIKIFHYSVAQTRFFRILLKKWSDHLTKKIKAQDEKE